MTVDPNEQGFGNLSAFRVQDTVTHGEAVLKDYDPTSPTKHLESLQRTLLGTGSASSRDYFSWPALTFDPAQVDRRTQFLMEAAEISVRLAEGSGFHEGFVPARTFTLESDPETGKQDEEFILQTVYHQATSDYFVAGGGGSTYSNSFVAVQSQLYFSRKAKRSSPPHVWSV